MVPSAPAPLPLSTVRPNQREMCSGSVRALHTFSMGAAMLIVRRTVKVLSSTTDAWLSVIVIMIFPFDGCLQLMGCDRLLCGDRRGLEESGRPRGHDRDRADGGAGQYGCRDAGEVDRHSPGERSARDSGVHGGRRQRGCEWCAGSGEAHDP